MFFLENSSNVTVEESSFKITPEAAKEILQKVPETMESSEPLDPISKLCLKKSTIF